MKVPYIDLSSQYKDIKNDVLSKISEIIDSGMFVLGEEVNTFENDIKKYTGSKYCLGLNSGTDALILALKAINIKQNDEVLVPPNSFLASASAIALAGAKPVFVDVNDDYTIDYNRIEAAITSKTKAIIAVHLTGRPACMDEIMEIAYKHKLFVIEDAAQAIGAKYKNQFVGSIGHFGCFSLHPLKNLAAAGDGGFITTNNEEFYSYLLKARNHGLLNRDECEFWSYNSRLDNIQAAILNVKLNKLEEWNNRRKQIAKIYKYNLDEYLEYTPVSNHDFDAVYHTYVVRTPKRDQLKEFLLTNGIDTKIHYPIPIHLQKSASYLGYKKGDFPIAEYHANTILSLPVYPELNEEQINYVINKIKEFFL